MRARGSKITDIVVLVVAANDGIMPQTIEAIQHSKAAKVPIIVAINKCDLPDKNITKIKTDLMKYELIAEEFSGETLFVEVSATKK
jgi:translation initiation factor IF-2